MTANLKQKLSGNKRDTTYEFVQDSKLRVTGHKMALKSTQTYPAEYGKSVIKSWEAWRSTKRFDSIVSDSSSDSDYDYKRCPSWPEAKLGPIIKKLQKKPGILSGNF